MKTALTVAGFDPSSGAGITRDLDTFSSLGIHGVALPTCTVVQGPSGVRTVHAADADTYRETMTVVREQIAFDGLKTGVLWDAFYVDALANLLRERPELPCLVVDPVLAAKNGTPLITGEGLKALKTLLFPLTSVVTPNRDEAEILSGTSVENVGDMKRSAEILHGMGPKAVIIKGGHLPGAPVDLLFDGEEFVVHEKARSERVVHGTGCSFSGLITAYLILGYPVKEAFVAAEEMMAALFRGSYRIGEEGYFYAASGIVRAEEAGRWRVLAALKEARERLLSLNMVELIPEVQMNLGFALENPSGIGDVAAFPGRIGRFGGKIVLKGEPEFGASSHVARLILTYMLFFPHVRSCASVRYGKDTVELARRKGLSAVGIDRAEEPESVSEQEGKSLDFLVKHVLERVEEPPDIIYDHGDVGKEPIIRLFGRTPSELIKKMEMIRS